MSHKITRGFLGTPCLSITSTPTEDQIDADILPNGEVMLTSVNSIDDEQVSVILDPASVIALAIFLTVHAATSD